MAEIVNLADRRPVRRGGGNNKGTRRGFGSVRQLPSGRWQARYLGPDDVEHRAPVTFAVKTDATKWLSMQQAAIVEHRWKPPAPTAKAAAPTFRDYATTWLDARELKPRTRDEYGKLLGVPKPEGAKKRNDARTTTTLFDHWAEVPVDAITAASVRDWWGSLDPTKPTRRAHLYALLRTIMGSAVEAGHITGNPCAIRGAGRAKRARRIEPATLDELAAIRANLDPRWHALVDVAAWCALRFGELAALQRNDLDLARGVLKVRRGVTWVRGQAIVGDPKTAAGVRDVTIPPHLIEPLREHLKVHAGPGRTGLVFPAESGGHLSHGTFYKHWKVAREAAGRPDLRLHDARHTGAVMAAHAGATTRELMDRLGHATSDMAMRYQHVADGRPAEIARRLSAMAKGAGL